MTQTPARPVSVTAHQVAEGYLTTASVAQAIGSSSAVPVSWDTLNQANAEHAAKHDSCTKAETIELLDTNREQAQALLAGMTDEQLDTTADLPAFGSDPVSAEQFTSMVVIGHLGMHLPGIQAGVGEGE